MAQNQKSKVKHEPPVINKPKVGAPIVKPIPHDGNPFGKDYATKPTVPGVAASQNAPKQVGQAAAKKQRPMYSSNRNN